MSHLQFKLRCAVGSSAPCSPISDGSPGCGTCRALPSSAPDPILEHPRIAGMLFLSPGNKLKSGSRFVSPVSSAGAEKEFLGNENSVHSALSNRQNTESIRKFDFLSMNGPLGPPGASSDGHQGTRQLREENPEVLQGFAAHQKRTG